MHMPGHGQVGPPSGILFKIIRVVADQQFKTFFSGFSKQTFHIACLHRFPAKPFIVAPLYFQSADFHIIFRQINPLIFQKTDAVLFQPAFIFFKHIPISLPVYLHPVFVVSHSVIHRILLRQALHQRCRNFKTGFFLIGSYHIAGHYNQIGIYFPYFRQKFFIITPITFIMEIGQKQDFYLLSDLVRTNSVFPPDKT